MAHQRQVIREAVVAQLMGETDAETRVFKTREIPLRRTELPAICVYTLEEAVDADSRQTAPRRLQRTLQLAVEIAAQNTENVDDDLDALALQVERALDADLYFGGACIESGLTSTQLGIDVSGDKPVGRCLMAYAVTYETESPAADDLPALSNFTKAHVETSLSGDQAAADRAVDDIPVPTT